MYIMILLIALLSVLMLHKSLALKQNHFDPTWESLDTRPLPQWYDDAKIGIFLHWGVYAVPSYGVGESSSSEWFWAYWKGKNKELVEFMNKSHPPKFTYQDFADDFTAEFFNATEWASLFKNAGAKYVVVTTKHHEGFTLWPSKYSFSWNSVDVGPHKDIVGELAEASRNTGLEFGTYYSMYEWYNPIYRSDKSNNFTTKEYVFNKYLPEITSLVNSYQPSVLWVDGEWDADYTYWNSTYFLAWLYNESPVKDFVVVNDRWGKGLGCKHGDFYSCKDRYNPKVLQKHKWEATATTDKTSWGFRRNAKLEDYMSTYELVVATVQAVSCGGNMLINVGPTKDGIIIPLVQQRLLDLGKWLELNGEAVYGSKPWKHQNDTCLQDVWYTANENHVYAFVLKWPNNNILTLYSATELFQKPDTKVKLLESNETIKWNSLGTQVSIIFPDKATAKSDLAWVVKISVK